MSTPAQATPELIEHRMTSIDSRGRSATLFQILLARVRSLLCTDDHGAIASSRVPGAVYHHPLHAVHFRRRWLFLGTRRVFKKTDGGSWNAIKSDCRLLVPDLWPLILRIRPRSMPADGADVQEPRWRRHLEIHQRWTKRAVRRDFRGSIEGGRPAERARRSARLPRPLKASDAIAWRSRDLPDHAIRRRIE